MIYSKFGSQLTLVSRQQASNGLMSVQATAGDTRDVRHYGLGDMTADGGATEINEAVAKLPWRVIVGKKAKLGQQLRAQSLGR
jgi:hypothetical protein